MLLDHEVEFAEVLLIAQPGAQNRPEVVILGLVVADELVTKLLSSVLGWSRNRLGTLEARRDLLEPGAVAPHSLRMGPRPGESCQWRYTKRPPQAVLRTRPDRCTHDEASLHDQPEGCVPLCQSSHPASISPPAIRRLHSSPKEEKAPFGNVRRGEIAMSTAQRQPKSTTFVSRRAKVRRNVARSCSLSPLRKR